MAGWFLGAGILLLLVGGEAAVRGGVGLARAFSMPPLLIGLFVISLATAAPELFVALRATATGAPDIALGGIIGTVLVNLLLVLGLGALIRPMSSPPKVVLRDGGALVFAALAVWFFAAGEAISRIDGLLLLLGFAAYVTVTYFTDWRRSPDHSVAQGCALSRMQGEPTHEVAGLFLLLLGLILLGLGAHFAVAGAVSLAHALNIKEAFVGLTIVALGVSLPKLIATLVATARGHTDLAAGCLIGASVVDLLFVLGVVATVTPLTVSPVFALIDVTVMAAASVVLLPLLAVRWRLSRPRGFMLLAAYACYVAFLAWRQGLISPAMLGL